MSFSCDESSSESTHDTCDIRTDTFTAGNLFKTAEHGIIVKSTTLYDDIFSELTCIGEFDNLK